MIAALYVQRGGAYFDLPGVDAWDEARDARLYPGPWPVVAHPPCQRWGKFYAGNPKVIADTGRRHRLGDDAGCFAAALAAVRKFGGVIEHPFGSKAWAAFGLNLPPRSGGWVNADFEGGWTCCVEQGRYGHYAIKPTYLLAYGCYLPRLDWGVSSYEPDAATVARFGSVAKARRVGQLALKGGGRDSSARIATPPAFRALLLDMARSVQAARLAA